MSKEWTIREITNYNPDKREQKTVSRNLIIDFNPDAGTKIFKYRFRDEFGKLKWYKENLGYFPATSLAEAKFKRNELLKLKNPNTELELQHKNDIKKKIDELTLTKVTEEWYEYYKKIVADTTAANKYYLLKNHIYKSVLGDMPIKDITTLDISNYILTLSTPIGSRLKTTLDAIFSFALEERGYIKNNVAPQKTLLKHKGYKSKKIPGITDIEELKELRNKIILYTLKDKIRGYALQLLFHTFPRPHELLNLKWKNVNLNKKQFTIYTKNKNTKIIPMSRPVFLIFINLYNLRLADRDITFNDNEYVIHQESSYNKKLTNGRISMALKDIGYSGDVHTPHGFRTTFSTLFHKNNEGYDMDNDKYPYEIIENALDHTVASSVSRIYNEYDYLTERTKIMKCWSKYINKL